MLNVLSTYALIMANMKSVAKQEKGSQAGTSLKTIKVQWNYLYKANSYS